MNEYDNVLIDGKPLPRVLEEWKRRHPDINVIGVRVVGDDDIEIHGTQAPRCGPIKSTVTYR